MKNNTPGRLAEAVPKVSRKPVRQAYIDRGVDPDEADDWKRDLGVKAKKAQKLSEKKKQEKPKREKKEEDAPQKRKRSKMQNRSEDGDDLSGSSEDPPRKKKKLAEEGFTDDRPKFEWFGKKVNKDDIPSVRGAKLQVRISDDLHKSAQRRKRAVSVGDADPLALAEFPQRTQVDIEYLKSITVKAEEIKGLLVPEVVQTETTSGEEKTQKKPRKKVKVPRRHIEQGKGKGEVLELKYNGVDVKVRMDVVRSKINPRISGGDGKDWTTQMLAGYGDSYAADSPEFGAFLQGLQGGPLSKGSNDDDKREQEEDAADVDYSDIWEKGIVTRAILMASDVVHFPGSSALTERMLDAVRTPDDYKKLFPGGSGDPSYGGLASQNIEGEKTDEGQRSAAYNFVGAVLDQGYGETGVQKSNAANLRKLNTMLSVDEGFAQIGVMSKGKSFRASRESLDKITRKQAAAKKLSTTDAWEAKGGLDIIREFKGTDEEEIAILLELPEDDIKAQVEKTRRQMETLQRNLRIQEEALTRKTKGQDVTIDEEK